jgi:molybdopterin-guanine dinucleotide biosynthesis protein A
MIVGAVLCGGRSTRMGTDKAVVAVDGVPMARRVAEALQAGGCDVVAAVGGDRAALEAIGLDVVDDPRQGEGPVAGVLAALQRWPEADAVVVVACDLPYLTGATVAALHGALGERRDVLAAIGHTDRLQPLCVAWRPAASPTVATALASGERRLHAVLAELPTTEVSVNRQDVTNVNLPEDLPTRL